MLPAVCLGEYHRHTALRMLPPCTAQSWPTADWQDALINSRVTKQSPVLSGAKQTECITTSPVPHLLPRYSRAQGQSPSSRSRRMSPSSACLSWRRFCIWLQNKQTNLVQCTKENFEVTFFCTLRYNVLRAQMKNCRSPYLRGKEGA